jgi:hypothetical protein
MLLVTSTINFGPSKLTEPGDQNDRGKKWQKIACPNELQRKKKEEIHWNQSKVVTTGPAWNSHKAVSGVAHLQGVEG